ncbi:hypothetical protein GCM10007387_11470 [Pseudoduganella albidiflava]|uniref:Uncharacterized protein n=1 Tax=Pseudoduganella albidiflava TaxID=321983 RepID=A0AA88C4I3_9BURK|nr:hypothetical protein GCM10007387_11470 [Pseudoduganella albidiflava]
MIEGIVTDLLVASEWDDLLDKIEKHCKASSAAVGAEASPARSHGQVHASPHMISFGEYDEYFVCLVGQQPMWGGISGARRLPVGKRVKAVVEIHGGVFIARGMISEEAGLAWLRCAQGSEANRRVSYKMSWWFFCLMMLFALPFTLLPPQPGLSRLELMSWIAGAIGATCFWLARMCIQNWRGLADEVTEILRIFGFADPERVDLGHYSYTSVHGYLGSPVTDIYGNLNDVYCYKQAIEDGKLKFAR